MDLTTIIGIVAGFGVVIYGILGGGELMTFYDLDSVFITIGGTIFASIASFPMKYIKTLGSLFGKAFKTVKIDYKADIEMIIDMANTARRDGLLALEDATSDMKDPFLQKGVMLIVDGCDPELVKSIMETELIFLQERHSAGQGMLLQMAEYGPAFGMIGTLIGLINMLKNLDDPGSLGPAMGVALITTFYGCMIANLICKPIAKKLALNSAEEYLEKELMLEGILAIQDGENPRIIRDKLNAFVSRSYINSSQKKNAGREDEGMDE